jgi:hypothetical protein
VSQYHRSPGAEEVEITIAIGVEEIRARGMGHEGGIAAYGAKGTHGRVNAAGEKSFGTKLQVAGPGEAAAHAFSIGGEVSASGRRRSPVDSASGRRRDM